MNALTVREVMISTRYERDVAVVAREKMAAQQLDGHGDDLALVTYFIRDIP